MINSVQSSVSKKRISRRDFVRLLGIFGLDVFLGAIVGWNYIDKIEPEWVEVKNVSLTLPRLPKSFSGFRLVQISDLHVGYWMTPDRLTNILEMVKEQTPDLVAITGDIVLAYGGLSPYKPIMDKYVNVFKSLTDTYTTVSVLGNHDYWYNAVNVKNALELAGVNVLMNSVFSLERSGERFHIAGLDDVYEHQHDLDAVLAALPEDGGAMLLAHEPDFADMSATTGRFDLQISGHSHGGQVVIPLIGPVVLPYLGKKYPSGLYKVGNMYQYTNRGVGMTMPSIRFNCRPEITVFTLEAA